MTFEEFERAASQAFEEIPEQYLTGIDGMTVSRDAPRHPDLPDVFTLGQCLTEEHVSDFGSSDTTRSTIVLYWGSFRKLAQRDPSFDWEGEIWDTLTHELRHHLESLARDDALEGVDYAADESFKRREGRPFDPWYYQHGDEVAPGVFDIEGEPYVEQEWTSEEFAAAEHLHVDWGERAYRFSKPSELGDVHYLWPIGGDPPVEVVLVRRRSWWEDVRRLFGSSRPVVLESEVAATPIEAGDTR